LLEAGLINSEQLKAALETQKEFGKKIGEVLVEKGYTTHKNIVEVLEFQLGMPYINLDIYPVDSKIVSLIPESMARKYEIVPVKVENGTITIAASDPFNEIAFDDVRIYTGYDVLPVMADHDKIEGIISKYSNSQKAIEAVEQFNKSNLIVKKQLDAISESEFTKEINDSPTVKLINVLIEQALQSRASDIHLEPQKDNLRIRFRIDGQLQDIMNSDKSILPLCPFLWQYYSDNF
jgi:type IV pilus assembly protein PilB